MTTENINLEKLIAELESIVNKMESDDLNVEDSLKSYEKGISLIKNELFEFLFIFNLESIYSNFTFVIYILVYNGEHFRFYK